MNTSLYKPVFAVVTAYYKEPDEVLARAIRSVRSLLPAGLEVRHYLIADGYPKFSGLDGCVHVPLPTSHGDYGDTPRMIGAMLAIRDACCGLMFLDADNYLYPDHLQRVLAARLATGKSLIVTKRQLKRPDGTDLSFRSMEDERYEHVDTGCFNFFAESMFEALNWARIPSQFSAYGDRYFWDLLRRRGVEYGLTEHTTVAYTCIASSVYSALGELPPEGAKADNDPRPVDTWFDALPEQEKYALKHRLELVRQETQ